MPAPLFLVPMRSEVAAVRFGAPRSAIERIGMGPEHTMRAQTDLAARLVPGQDIVVLGICGGLVPELRTGDVVVASRLSPLDSPETIDLEGADDIAAQLAGHRARVRVAPIVSSSSILHGDAARAHAASGGAVGVDMESFWCTPLLQGHRLAVVRVVLDVFGKSNVSPRMLHAATTSFRSLAQVARIIHAARKNLDPVRPTQKIGET